MAETKREGAEYHTGAEKAQKTVAATTSTRKRRGTATLATPAHPLKRAKPSSPEQSGCRAEAESKASTHLTALSDVPLAPKTSQALSTRSRPNKGKFGGLAHNVENAGFPPGEIEFNRSGKRIGWNMVFAVNLVTPGKILFSSHDWRYGGPFGFLSTHAPCKINVPKLLDGFSFLNVEHAHQYNKARCMKLSEVRITTRISPNVSSRRIVGLVLDARNMTTTEMAEFVDKFDDFYLTDRPWWDEWQSAYLLVVDRVLKYALRAKFESSVDLKMKLMMTGEYELCYANNANSIDPWLGIGFPAHIAMAFQPKWNQNLLGKALMVVRSEIRAKEPQWPKTFAFDHFRALEMSHRAKQEDPKKPISPSPSAREAQATWLRSGDESLPALMDRLKVEETAYHRRRVEMAAAFEKKMSERYEQAKAAMRAQRQQESEG